VAANLLSADWLPRLNPALKIDLVSDEILSADAYGFIMSSFIFVIVPTGVLHTLFYESTLTFIKRRTGWLTVCSQCVGAEDAFQDKYKDAEGGKNCD
jgi:hypothetical protein